MSKYDDSWNYSVFNVRLSYLKRYRKVLQIKIVEFIKLYSLIVVTFYVALCFFAIFVSKSSRCFRKSLKVCMHLLYSGDGEITGSIDVNIRQGHLVPIRACSEWQWQLFHPKRLYWRQLDLIYPCLQVRPQMVESVYEALQKLRVSFMALFYIRCYKRIRFCQGRKNKYEKLNNFFEKNK